MIKSVAMPDFKKWMSNENLHSTFLSLCRRMNSLIIILYGKESGKYFKVAGARDDRDADDECGDSNEFQKEGDPDFSELSNLIKGNKMTKNKWSEFINYFKEAFSDVIVKPDNELDGLLKEVLNYAVTNNLLDLMGPSTKYYNTILINDEGKNFIMHYLRREL